jgi:thymidylate kinase
LLKKIAKGELTDEQGAFLSALWRSDPEDCHALLAQCWPARTRFLVADAGRSGRWDEARNALPQLSRDIRNASRSTIGLWCQEFARRVRRVLQPTGFVVAFLGPDGSGKTSVAEAVQRDLAAAFKSVQRYHLRPEVLGQRAGQRATSTPHEAPARGQLASVAKLAFWWLEYAVGFATQIAPRRMRSHLLVFDRYFDDLLVDPKRYCYSGPLWLVALCRRFVPRPDLLIVLDALPERLLARKQEITSEAAERLAGAYRALARDNDFQIVDASVELKCVVDTVASLVLDHLAARTARRLGLEAASSGACEIDGGGVLA